MAADGKVAVVLGGAGGMGRACCKALLKNGAKVICGDIVDEKTVSDFGSDKSFVYLKCDSTSDDDVNNLFAATKSHFGKMPDVVLTTVAIIDEFDWQKCLEVNVGATIRLVNAALASMGKDKGGEGGAVVLLSSISGLKPEFWGPVYSATKHAVTALARSWALEENYRLHGIRFNSICPAAVDTPFLLQVKRAYFYDQHQTEQKTAPKIAPETIADAFMRIVNDESMNGASILITTKESFHEHQFSKVDF